MEDEKNIMPADYVDRTSEQFELLENVIPTEVCHYTGMDTALEKILSGKKIRLGNITLTNDPRESKERIFSYKVAVENGEISRFEYGYEKSLREWRVFCTSCHNDPMWGLDFVNIPLHLDKYGIGHSSMWAHYAGNHKGVCLLFDGKILDKNIQKTLTEKQYEIRNGFVKYNDEKATELGVTNDLEYQQLEEPERKRRSLLKHYKNNFLYKSTEWKIEHEFRWLVRSQDTSEIYISIEKAIKAVIVGEDFHKVYMPSLNNLCEELRIPQAYRIKWTNGIPQLIQLA